MDGLGRRHRSLGCTASLVSRLDPQSSSPKLPHGSRNRAGDRRGAGCCRKGPPARNARCAGFLIERAESEEERYHKKFAEGVSLFEGLFARTDDLTQLTTVRATQEVFELARFLTVNAPISNDDLKLITFDLERQARQDRQLAFGRRTAPCASPGVEAGGKPTGAERSAKIAETARIWARQKAPTF
jgi:hypothetical protein